MADLSDIITSKVRIKILKLVLSDVSEMYHVRGIVRKVGEEINAVRRELKRLEEGGLLQKEKRGNRIYYWSKEDYIFFEDLLSMVAKSTGLGAEIIASKNKIGRPSFVMFSGGFARHKKSQKDDRVDILVVGNVVLPELAALIRKEETTRAQEINYTVMNREELDFRKKRRDPFITSVLAGSRIMIIGEEQDLVS